MDTDQGSPEIFDDTSAIPEPSAQEGEQTPAPQLDLLKEPTTQEYLDTLSVILEQDRENIEVIRTKMLAEGKSEQEIEVAVQPILAEHTNKQIRIYEQNLRDEGRLAPDQKLTVKEFKDYISGLLISENSEDQALLLGATGQKKDSVETRREAINQTSSMLQVLLSNEGMTMEDLFRQPVLASGDNQTTAESVQTGEMRGLETNSWKDFAEKAEKAWDTLEGFREESNKVGEDVFQFEAFMDLLFYNEMHFRSIYGESSSHLTDHGMEEKTSGQNETQTLKMFEEVFSDPEKKQTFISTFSKEMGHHLEDIGDGSYDSLYNYFTKIATDPDEHSREKKLHVIKESLHKAAEAAHSDAIHTLKWDQISLGNKAMTGFFLYLRRSA